MAEPPESIRAFYEHIQSLSTPVLRQHPKYLDPAASERTIQCPFIPADLTLAVELQADYARIQDAFYDFTGHCQMCCPLSYKHHHSIQAKGVLQMKGFPGVFIFQQVFNPVLPELLDAVMELHQEEDAVRSKDSSPQVDADVPCPKSIVLPPKLGDLMHRTFFTAFELDSPINATLSISTAERSAGLKKPNLLAGNIAHLSLGLDAILVLGDGTPDVDGAAEGPAKQSLPGSRNDWQDLVNLDSDEEGVDGPQKGEEEVIQSATNAPSSTPNLVALHLRAGDVLVFDEKSSNTWYGIAKVLEGSSRVGMQWPHLREEEQETGAKVMRGQLNGKAVQVEFQ